MPPTFLTDEPQGPRDALRPLANGKLVALAKFVLPILLSLVGAYLTAQEQTQDAIEDARKQIAVSVERENNHYGEVMRAIQELKEEVRELRKR